MLKKPSILILLLAIASILFLSLLFLKSKNSGPIQFPPGPAPAKAFMNTVWGMSAQEVQEAVQADLTPAEVGTRFYSPKNPAVNESKIKAYEQIGLDFLGRKATVTYIFYMDRLFIYRVSVRSSDADALDSDVTQHLMGQFGEGFVQEDPKASAKIIWQTKDLIVNYWLYQDDLRLVEKFSAVFAVMYQPLERLVQ